MNAKETAEQLVDKHFTAYEFPMQDIDELKKHAIITATELSKHSINAAFWHEVITELEKL